MAELLRAAEIEPANEAAQQEMARSVKNRGAAPTSDTSAGGRRNTGRDRLDRRARPAEAGVQRAADPAHERRIKVIYQAIGKAAGVNVLFDPDYTSKRIQVDLNSVTLVDACISSAPYPTPSGADHFEYLFVAQNTAPKHRSG